MHLIENRLLCNSFPTWRGRLISESKRNLQKATQNPCIHHLLFTNYTVYTITASWLLRNDNATKTTTENQLSGFHPSVLDVYTIYTTMQCLHCKHERDSKKYPLTKLCVCKFLVELNVILWIKYCVSRLFEKW